MMDYALFVVDLGEPNMHFIRRSQNGLGIEENVVTGCLKCHAEYDDGKYRKEHEKDKYCKGLYYWKYCVFCLGYYRNCC